MHVAAGRAPAGTAHYYHPHGADVCSMAFPSPRGGSSSCPYYSSSSAAAFSPPFGAARGVQQQHLHVLDYLPDEVGPPAAPGTFGTPPPPPPRMPVEPIVPDAAAGYCAHSRSAAAVSGRDKIAFRTRSEEEILDDGYKWRKYGKKSVKNSPNSRNYYRCSTEGCNVKKRVERDNDAQSYVVTTYEGIHNHANPGTVYYAVQDAVSGRFFVAGMHRSG